MMMEILAVRRLRVSDSELLSICPAIAVSQLPANIEVCLQFAFCSLFCVELDPCFGCRVRHVGLTGYRCNYTG
jgi:hypothetical protein